MKTPLTRARPAAQANLFEAVESEKNATQKPVSKSSKKTPAKSASKPARSTPVAAQTKKLSAKKSVAARSVVQPAMTESPIKKSVAPAKAKTSVSATTPILKATKKRAPRDLANQYGAGDDTTVRAVAAVPAPRKRRNAATRAKLQAVITPDDALLLRLARAGAISSSHVSENGSGGEKSFRSSAKRRSRKWETRCGKCGVSAQYAAAAALCVKCGAILVRD